MKQKTKKKIKKDEKWFFIMFQIVQKRKFFKLFLIVQIFC